MPPRTIHAIIKYNPELVTDIVRAYAIEKRLTVLGGRFRLAHNMIKAVLLKNPDVKAECDSRLEVGPCSACNNTEYNIIYDVIMDRIVPRRCCIKCSTLPSRDGRFIGHRKTAPLPLAKIVKTLISRARSGAKSRRLVFDIDVDFITTLFRHQRGICAITRQPMFLCLGDPSSPSIDRINSSEGYEKDNIQMVCMAIQFAKNSFTNEDMKTFVSRICSYNQVLPHGVAAKLDPCLEILPSV